MENCKKIRWNKAKIPQVFIVPGLEYDMEKAKIRNNLSVDLLRESDEVPLLL